VAEVKTNPKGLIITDLGDRPEIHPPQMNWNSLKVLGGRAGFQANTGEIL